MLGYCYMNGTGVDQDDEMAQYWLHQAAQRGNYDAKELLSEFFFEEFEEDDFGDEPEYDDEEEEEEE